MFIFKKIFSKFFFPLPLVLYIFLSSLFLLWFTKKQKTGKILISIGILLFLLFSNPGVPSILLEPLERKYEPLNSYSGLNNFQTDDKTSHQLIVVLGGGSSPDPDIPLTSQLDYDSLVRLIEGIRIYREIPGSKLILSGSSVAQYMADVAKVIGVDEHDIKIEIESKDTKDQAKIIKSFVKDDQFILVTSASHMPRSIALFRKLNMNPIPAPAGHLIKKDNKREKLSPSLFFPSGKDIVKTERAFYEYMGIAWAKLRGQI